MHSRDIAAVLESLRRRLAQEGIPFAVIGALALRHYGYVRHTEDIDILTTREGLDRLHATLVGQGLAPRGPGLRKSLRETDHQVNIDVVTSGEHAGSPESPVQYPPPPSSASPGSGSRHREGQARQPPTRVTEADAQRPHQF